MSIPQTGAEAPKQAGAGAQIMGKLEQIDALLAGYYDALSEHQSKLEAIESILQGMQNASGGLSQAAGGSLGQGSPEAHHEACCLAFGKIYDAAGHEYSLTIRQGVKAEDVASLLAVLEQIPILGAKHGFTCDYGGASGSYSGASHQSNGAKAQAGAGASKLPSDYQPLDRIIIEGTVDKPMVAMYSSNHALKFPLIKVPASFLSKHFEGGYGLAKVAQAYGYPANFLQQCGQTYAVDWGLKTQPSPENPKWKDLVGVYCPKLEGAKP